MSKKRHSMQDIADVLTRVEKAVAQGASMAEAARQVGVKYSTVYHWRRRYANVTKLETVRRLEAENARLRRALLEFDQRSLASGA
jgi:transposase-like protein